jgi:NitT/TauT family transport system substrate-binding protein
MALALGVYAWNPASAAETGARCTPSSPTVNIGISQRAFSYLPTVLAQEKGFYCDEGLNVSNSIISDAAGPPAVVSGGLDYIVNVANVTAAAAGGLEVRMVSMITSKQFFVLVAPSNIRSVQELKGQLIGITAPGSSTASMLNVILAANNVAASEVKMQPLGNGAAILAALSSKQIQAGIIYPPFDVEAVQQGFIRLVKASDVTKVPLNTLVTSATNIQKNPDQVKKILRGTLKALQYIQSNREGTIQVMQTNFGLSAELAANMYDAYKDIFSPDGTISEVQAQAAIDDARSRLPAAASLTPAKLVDSTILTAVQKEMAAK